MKAILSFVSVLTVFAASTLPASAHSLRQERYDARAHKHAVFNEFQDSQLFIEIPRTNNYYGAGASRHDDYEVKYYSGYPGPRYLDRRSRLHDRHVDVSRFDRGLDLHRGTLRTHTPRHQYSTRCLSARDCRDFRSTFGPSYTSRRVYRPTRSSNYLGYNPSNGYIDYANRNVYGSSYGNTYTRNSYGAGYDHNFSHSHLQSGTSNTASYTYGY